jgi:hypothetical protein
MQTFSFKKSVMKAAVSYDIQDFINDREIQNVIVIFKNLTNKICRHLCCKGKDILCFFWQCL